MDNSYMRKYMRRYSAERRLKAIQILGGKCVLCGSEQDLEIDHIDPSTKSFTLGSGWHHNWNKIRNELTKCQLLCKIHHIEKTRKEQGVNHGEGLTGKKNCRCELCAPLKNAYNREAKRNRKGKA